MRLGWDDIGQRHFKAGIDRGVLYPMLDDEYLNGVAWNGITGVDDGTSGHDQTMLYTADRRTAILFSPYDKGGTIKCYTYPDEFDDCIGNLQVAPGLFATAQEQTPFGLCYRVKLGNDVKGIDAAYELHLIYGAVVTEGKFSPSTINSDLNIQELSFSYECTVEEAENHEATAHMVINSRLMDPEKLATLEAILYGDDDNDPRLPLPDELYDIFRVIPPVPEVYAYYPHDNRYPSTTVYPMVDND